jgi:hypothetical protein
MEVSAMEEALPKATARRKGGLRTIPFIICKNTDRAATHVFLSSSAHA